MAGAYKSISVIIPVSESWVVMLPYTLYSISRQLYPLEKIEVIIITTDDCYDSVVRVCQRFPDLVIRILLDDVSGVHDPSYRKRLGWQAAQGELFVGLDADVILPAHMFTYLATILRYRPGFAVYAHRRIEITVSDLEIDINKTFSKFEVEECASGGCSGRAVIDDVYPKHPWACPSFFFGVERALLTSEDFVTDYSGMWGVEDNDLAARMYKRGTHQVAHPHLTVLHWNHPRQSTELYGAQLRTVLKRHTESYIINRDQAMMYSHERLPKWSVPRSPSVPYELHIEPQGANRVNSSSIVLSSLYIAMRTQARFDGRPLPTLGSQRHIEHLLPHARLLGRHDYRDENPSGAARQIRLWGLTNGKNQPIPPRGSYSIGYLALEGEIVRTDYYNYLQLFDAVWVSSHRNAKTLQMMGWHKPLAVIPLGVFSEYFYPHRFIPQRDARFMFLTVGVGERKQIYEIIDRFATEFSPHERVGLTICDYLQSDLIRKYIRQHWPKWELLIHVGGSEESYFAISKHYLASDAFVTASRGEAWQMPVLEAMASGMPVIVPRDNGIPYVNETNAIMYDSTPVRADAQFGYVEPDLSAMVRAMRALVTNPQLAKKRAHQLVETVHAQYSWFEAARIAWQWLDECVPHD